MNKIIDRAAMAMAEREGYKWSDLHETEDTSFGLGRSHIRALARVVIEALHDPSEDIIDALYDEANDVSFGSEGGRRAWNSAIDAILKD